MKRLSGALPVLGVAAVLVLAGCGASGGQARPSGGAAPPASAATPGSGATGSPAPTGSGEAPGPVRLPNSPATELGGLQAPWSIVFLGSTALVGQRDDGAILELLPGGGSRLVGTVDGVQHRSEAGLLGLALDQEQRLYAYSTGPGGNRIQRFALTGQPGSLGLGPAQTILDGLPSAANHNGGRIAFGPDGMLYATVGDAGRRAEAQDLGSLAGKILRMTPDGAVPPGNPIAGSLVYSSGHRNPQGIAWTEDGTMLATEFGQDSWDELNVIVPGGNYGWPVVEGAAGDPAYRDPLQQWPPSEASPSGMAILGGTVYIANLRGEVLRTVPLADPSASAEHYAHELGRLRDIAVGPDGALWVLTNNTDGRGTPQPGDDRLLRIQPS